MTMNHHKYHVLLRIRLTLPLLWLYMVHRYMERQHTVDSQTHLVRQPIEGSGFAVALRVNDRGVSAPYSLKGFQLEFDVGARR